MTARSEQPRRGSRARQTAEYDEALARKHPREFLDEPYHAARTTRCGRLTLGDNTIGAVEHDPDFPEVDNVLSHDTVNGFAGTATLPGVQYVHASAGNWGIGGDGAESSVGTLTLPTDGSKILTTEDPFGVGGDSVTPSLAAPTEPTVTVSVTDDDITVTVDGD